ncbi:MAG: HAMP domain-containing sensor histidine kinase [Blautia sp.]|jgi:signal transduction histidine kinase
MIYGMVILALLLLLTGFRLYLYKRQIGELGKQLERLSQGSNQRLTCFLRDRKLLSLCSLLNGFIDAQQQTVLEAEEAKKELKYTMASISHDIRTPLTGASGYVQMAQITRDFQKQKEYLQIVRDKLKDLEQLLEELFLYTRLTGEQIKLDCQPLQLFPLLCQVLAGFYQQFEAQTRTPCLDFPREEMTVLADVLQMKRVLGNLISNSLAHGQGPLYIVQKENQLLFSNQVREPDTIRPEQLFARFYREDTARKGPHAGLGLSIAKELMERMGGTIEGKIEGDVLTFILTFSVPYF